MGLQRPVCLWAGLKALLQSHQSHCPRCWSSAIVLLQQLAEIVHPAQHCFADQKMVMRRLVQVKIAPTKTDKCKFDGAMIQDFELPGHATLYGR